MTNFIAHIKEQKKRTELLRKKHFAYPPPDEIDELDDLAIAGKISENDYYSMINNYAVSLTDWFKNEAPKQIEEIFAKYL